MERFPLWVLRLERLEAGIESRRQERQFQESMTNVTLTGFFTVGDGSETRPDTYTIGPRIGATEPVSKFET